MKAVIFDLDNTLVDFMKFKRFSCEEAVDAMIDAGMKVDKSKALKDIYRLYDKHGMEDPTVFQRFLKQMNGEIDYRVLAYAINAYRRARSGVLSTYPGTKRTLVKLKEKGLKLGVVTDAPRLKAWLRLVGMRLDDFFDVVVTNEDTGRLKPSKLPFKSVIKKLGIDASECLMVGDNPSRDIKGAKKLGMKTCFAKYGYDGKKKNFRADYEIDNIEELVEVVDLMHRNV